MANKDCKSSDDEHISTKELQLEENVPETSLDDVAAKYKGAFNEDDYIDLPPDGGVTAWLCCFAIVCINFATWGINVSFSIFLNFYLTNNVFPEAKPYDYAFIGGVVVCFTLLLTPVSALILHKYGYKACVCTGVIFQLAAYFGAAFSRNIHELFFTQGVLQGIAIGLIFGANLIVLPSWFLKKRAIANGFSHFGIGLGGVTFSLIINKMLESMQNQRYALIAVGSISAVICLSAMFLVKVRVPKNARITEDNNSSKDILKNVFRFEVLKSWPLQLAAIWSGLCQISYTILMFSLSNYATSLGFSKNQATIVNVCFNVGQAFGRPLMGLISDIVGRVNFTIFATAYGVVMVLAVWINIDQYYQLVIFSVFLGLFAGIASVNIVPLVVDVVGLNDYPPALSYVNMIAAFCSLIAEAIGLNLRDYSLQNPYLHCQIFVGCVYFSALILLLPYREWKVNRMLVQLKDSTTIDESTRVEYTKLHNDRTIIGYLRRCLYAVKT
ncbi:hypothetical protein WICPIJ_008318 [Wickerhamomyces pijperi]|uniref:Major facilitator superfamily (MFS) profile domain-containing protein n=1 Tax=Wickerhamomyces pijperi TaxID=599730 RepID=A0A9P8TIS6_WICPI|nr:hypothetical protein WICPIJ_008318 [Wickerhamomyces pijperi]